MLKKLWNAVFAFLLLANGCIMVVNGLIRNRGQAGLRFGDLQEMRNVLEVLIVIVFLAVILLPSKKDEHWAVAFLAKPIGTLAVMCIEGILILFMMGWISEVRDALFLPYVCVIFMRRPLFLLFVVRIIRWIAKKYGKHRKPTV